jgi:hypothetical protein
MICETPLSTAGALSLIGAVCCGQQIRQRFAPSPRRNSVGACPRSIGVVFELVDAFNIRVWARAPPPRPARVPVVVAIPGSTCRANLSTTAPYFTFRVQGGTLYAYGADA